MTEHNFWTWMNSLTICGFLVILLASPLYVSGFVVSKDAWTVIGVLVTSRITPTVRSIRNKSQSPLPQEKLLCSKCSAPLQSPSTPSATDPTARSESSTPPSRPNT